jgi:hypothetical protein
MKINNIIKYSSMQQIIREIDFQIPSEIISVSNNYHNIFNLQNDNYYLLYYDWFPHIKFYSEFWDSEFLFPTKQAEKINPNYDILYWNGKKEKIISFDLNYFIWMWNWEQYEIILLCCRNCKNIIEIKINEKETKKYCKFQLPSILKSNFIFECEYFNEKEK